MTEEAARYEGENDPPAAVTMMERLRRALIAELQRQRDSFDGGTGLGWFDPPGEGYDVARLDGEIELRPVIRAVLAEMREAADEDGSDVIGSPMDFMNTIDAILAEGGKSNQTSEGT